jgi:protein NirF
MKMIFSALNAVLLLVLLSGCNTLRGTGDMGVVIERATGSVQIIETTHQTKLNQVDGLGDLSHASIVFSRDERFAYVFGRDGGLTKIDLLTAKIDKRIIQSGNSIGGQRRLIKELSSLATVSVAQFHRMAGWLQFPIILPAG